MHKVKICYLKLLSHCFLEFFKHSRILFFSPIMIKSFTFKQTRNISPLLLIMELSNTWMDDAGVEGGEASCFITSIAYSSSSSKGKKPVFFWRILIPWTCFIELNISTNVFYYIFLSVTPFCCEDLGIVRRWKFSFSSKIILKPFDINSPKFFG